MKGDDGRGEARLGWGAALWSVSAVRREWDIRAALDPERAVWDSAIEYDEGARLCLDALTFGLRPQPHWRCLEIGCGTGRMMAALVPHVREVIGCDMSPVMVERARAALEGRQNCRVVLSRDGGIPIGTTGVGFDLTYAVLVLQHNPRAMCERLLSEARRIAAREGWLRVQFYTGPASDTEPLQYPLSPAEIVELVRGASWRVVETDIGLGHRRWAWVTATAG